MSSFYGNGGGSGGNGSNLSNDYNKVANTPITNIGSSNSSNFVVLSGLKTGHYNLDGYYKLDGNDTLHKTDSPLDILIYKDSNTGYKVIQFFTTEDGTVYLNTSIYDDGNLVKHDKVDLTDNTQQWD